MAKEIVLQEGCPGCYQDSKTDNPLRAMPGSFNGNYCVVGEDNHHGHEYMDTLELNAELIKVAKMKKKAGVPMAPKAAPSPVVAPPSTSPQANSAQADKSEETAPMREPAAFEISETDSGRLGELLGQPIPDASTLVGAVFALKSTSGQNEVVAERATASKVSLDSTISKAIDGSLALQAYFPWSAGRNLVEKAQFNNMNLQALTQETTEYLMGTNYFPGGLTDIEVSNPEPYDGFWIVLRVPELYVDAMLAEAETRGVTPTQYLQAFIERMIQSEQFV